MDEDDFDFSSLGGLGLDGVLSGLELPSASGLSNELGLSGLNGMDPSWLRGDGAIGAGQGEDFEEEVNNEIGDEEDVVSIPTSTKEDVQSPTAPPVPPRKKRKVVISGDVGSSGQATPLEQPRNVQELYPWFERGKVLNFTSLYPGGMAKKSRFNDKPIQVEQVKPTTQSKSLPIHDIAAGFPRDSLPRSDTNEELQPRDPNTDLSRALISRAQIARAKGSNFSPALPMDDRSYDLVLLADWEKQIIYDPRETPALSQLPDFDQLPNPALDSGAWVESIIWDRRAPFRDFTQLELNLEQSTTQRDDRVSQSGPQKKDDTNARNRKKNKGDNIQAPSLTRKEKDQRKDPFNLSNDAAYEAVKEGGTHRVRQTFGKLEIQHAYPAAKLQMPFYKTRLGKADARSFHRPALQFSSNVEIRFHKVRSVKKRRDKSGRKIGANSDPMESMRRTTDISLKDTCNFVLWEYSEEHPPVMSNVGMASILVNYYRKTDEKDDFVPQGKLGEPFILENSDATPFLKLGSVQPGETVPALYNNLVRAPLFKHEPYNTDFLVIKNTIKGESRYYIREIQNLFVVGQTYPVTEVYGPHSRKYTHAVKKRLEVMVNRLLRKIPEERMKISRIMKYFPDQNDLQMRTRLKEFMEYHRRGAHQGFWRLKEGTSLMNDVEMLEAIKPEDVVLTESMQVGQRHLLDAGYGKAGADADDRDESKLDVEQKLAPWVASKNLINASQGKAMLQLHGQGDPTGRGEAFSFIRVSMKGAFVKAGEDIDEKIDDTRNKSGHRYNVAEQNKSYAQEVERIWRAQHRALSNKVEPELSDEEETKSVQQPASRSMSLSRDIVAESPGPFSRASSVDFEQHPSRLTRVLKIQRFVDGEWKNEFIRDPHVIKAYMRAKEDHEMQNQSVENLVPTGNEEIDAKARERILEEIARARKNQERRLQRKNTNIVKAGGTPIPGTVLKGETKRHCGHCGQMGHMKTNRKCPRWAEFNPGLAASSAASPSPSTSTPNVGSGTAHSPPPASPRATSGGYGRETTGYFPAPANRSQFGHQVAVPSPLATSPPYSAFSSGAGAPSPGASGSLPKIKLKLGGKKI